MNQHDHEIDLNYAVLLHINLTQKTTCTYQSMSFLLHFIFTLNLEFVQSPLRTFNIDTVSSLDPLFNNDMTLGNSPNRKEIMYELLNMTGIKIQYISNSQSDSHVVGCFHLFLC